MSHLSHIYTVCNSNNAFFAMVHVGRRPHHTPSTIKTITQRSVWLNHRVIGNHLRHDIGRSYIRRL